MVRRLFRRIAFFVLVELNLSRNVQEERVRGVLLVRGAPPPSSRGSITGGRGESLREHIIVRRVHLGVSVACERRIGELGERTAVTCEGYVQPRHGGMTSKSDGAPVLEYCIQVSERRQIEEGNVAL